jgi:hypothetical protein
MLSQLVCSRLTCKHMNQGRLRLHIMVLSLPPFSILVIVGPFAGVILYGKTSVPAWFVWDPQLQVF